MNILICDDMKYEANLLADFITDSGFEVDVSIYNNPMDALEYVRSGAELDVCFLDILMPTMTGIELAEKLRDGGYTGFIVFLTSANSYAPESYRVKAFDYLMKPTVPGRVKEVLTELDKAIKNSDNSGVLIKGAGISRMLLFREISHLEVIQNIVNIQLFDGTVHKARATLAEIAPKLLMDSRFIQCHRSYIVNLSGISALHGSTFVMRDGTNVPISRKFTDAKTKYISNTQRK